MRDIMAMGDASELLNQFSAKYILYVEGPGDRTAYRQIVGASFLVDHDFQLPPAGTGANAVRNRVREERISSNRVFGFLDGEAAAAMGAAHKLVQCDDLLFTVEDPDLSGLIFIAAHEIENLILSYCDVAPTIASHKPLAKMADGEADLIRKRLETLTGRFLTAAMFKYASLHLQHKGQCVHVANTRIFADDSLNLKQVLAGMKIVITQQLGLDWPVFVAELFTITRAMRDKVAAVPQPALGKERRHLRLADGKQLLQKLRGQAGKEVEGHLLGVLARSSFAGDLCDAIRSEIALAA
ncbi:MAG: hypothetical protein WC816_07990 [Sphingomonas sp.]|jgi:hypothetical protein